LRDEEDSGFKYRGRSIDTINQRATQTAGAFDSYTNAKFPKFKVSDGDNEIRIMPLTWNDVDTWGDNWGIELWVHHSIGPDNNAYLCLKKMKGQDCYLCDAQAEHAHDDDAEDQDSLARKLKPTRRILAWLVDRKKEKDGPVLWAMPWTLERDIQGRCKNKKTGEPILIDHPSSGYDVSFNKTGKERLTKYVSVDISREPSPLSDDGKTKKKWLEFIEQNPLPDTLCFYDNDYIEKMFRGKSPKRNAEDAPEGVEDKAPVKASVKPKSAPKQVTAEEVEDMTREQMVEAIEANPSFGIDPDDYPKTAPLRAALLKALDVDGAGQGDAEEKSTDSLAPVKAYTLEVMDAEELAELINTYKLDIDPDDYPKIVRLKAKVESALEEAGLLDKGAKEETKKSGRVQREPEPPRLDPVSQDKLDDLDEEGFESLIKEYKLNVTIDGLKLSVIRKKIKEALIEKDLFESGDAPDAAEDSSIQAKALARLKAKRAGN